MWFKLEQVVDGKQTGFWQWFSDEVSIDHLTTKVCLASGRQGTVYPGIWLDKNAICPPPKVGRCFTNIDKQSKIRL